MAISYGGISGSAPDPIREDLITIYQGGEHFIERMAALEAAKQRADEALTALQIGNDIQSAKADAQAKVDEATKLRDTAKATLNDAKAKAAKILDDGQAKANALMDAATKQRDQAVADATAAKAEADAYVAKAKADSLEIYNDARRQLENANAAESQMKAKTAAADAAKADAEKAKAECEAAKALYEKKMAQIKAVMG